MLCRFPSCKNLVCNLRLHRGVTKITNSKYTQTREHEISYSALAAVESHTHHQLSPYHFRPDMNVDYKTAKEAWVSNLNGSSLYDIHIIAGTVVVSATWPRHSRPVCHAQLTQSVLFSVPVYVLVLEGVYQCWDISSQAIRILRPFDYTRVPCACHSNSAGNNPSRAFFPPPFHAYLAYPVNRASAIPFGTYSPNPLPQCVFLGAWVYLLGAATYSSPYARQVEKVSGRRSIRR